MAKQTLTLNKMPISGGPSNFSSTGMVGSSGGLPFEVNSPDPSKLFFLVYDNTTAGAAMRASTTGATGARSGMGDAVLLTTAQIDGTSNYYVVGPFEASRFVDNSTGGKVIRVTFYTTAGTSEDTSSGAFVSAFQIYPSTDGIISTT